MKEAVDDIMVTLNEAASEGGMVGGMVESITEAMGRVSAQTKRDMIFHNSVYTKLHISVLQKMKVLEFCGCLNATKTSVVINRLSPNG